MIETILQIDDGAYPFDENNSENRTIKVTEVQTFSTLKELSEKKREMQAKNRLVSSPYIIKMTNIYQDELSLHYFYEHVPFSLNKYIQQNYKLEPMDSDSTRAKFFTKKISYDLTSLIAYLAHLKIEVDLSIDNLGITADQKLKLYMNTKCRMGHKTELSLVAYYSQCKEKIMNHLETALSLKTKEQTEQNPPNFVIKGNRLLFPSDKLNESGYSHCHSNCQPETTEYERVYNTTQDSNLFNTSHYSSHQKMPNTLPKKNNLRQTQSPNFSQSFNFSEAKGPKRKTNFPKNHKSSFQFGAKPSERVYTDKDSDNSDAKSFTHSRSIRIEMEQKIDPSLKKQRKDSYKVKITTFHEYQMEDCNPNDIFSNVHPQKSKDIFEYFEKQANNQQKNSHQQAYEPERSYKSTQPTPFQRKQSMADYGLAATTATKNIEQKVRLAKQKAQNILNRYMKSKNKKTVTLNRFDQ